MAYHDGASWTMEEPDMSLHSSCVSCTAQPCMRPHEAYSIENATVRNSLEACSWVDALMHLTTICACPASCLASYSHFRVVHVFGCATACNQAAPQTPEARASVFAPVGFNVFMVVLAKPVSGCCEKPIVLAGHRRATCPVVRHDQKTP